MNLNHTKFCIRPMMSGKLQSFYIFCISNQSLGWLVPRMYLCLSCSPPFLARIEVQSFSVPDSPISSVLTEVTSCVLCHRLKYTKDSCSTFWSLWLRTIQENSFTLMISVLQGIFSNDMMLWIFKMLINIIFEFTGNNLFQLIILLFITIATRVCFLPNVLEINEIKYKEK